MEINLKEYTIRDVVNGYVNNDEEGVVGFGGKLNIRPKYQREFVYKDKQRDEVINTINNGFPLNVMYWAKNNEEDYEVLDGQQRTISFCEYVAGNFSINNMAFHNLTQSEQEKILDYKLFIYVCEGTDKEKLDWFKIINIASEPLRNQELRNAIYTGEWLTDAKRHFSKSNCAGYNLGKDYLSGDYIRQDYLETVIKWISEDNIEAYMSKYQHAPNANELWLYFTSVITWIQTIFPNYRKEMKGIEWGELYNKYKDIPQDSEKLEEQIKELMQDEDVTNKKGIYSYIFDGDERHLNIRAFNDKEKREAYEKQNGICVICKNHFEFEQMEGDHITPWHEGGKTDIDNLQMLCKDCNRRKSGK